MSRVKVRFPISNSIENGVEIMHAKPICGNRFILDNSPFYAFGISFCDEFLVEEIDGERTFSSIASRGGHSTYRIKLPEGKDHEYFLKHWGKLEDLGCSFEGSTANMKRLYSVDLPPHVDVHVAYKILQDNENLGIWEFEEGFYSGTS
jgi:hypothetical protein